MRRLLNWLGALLARFLTRPTLANTTGQATDPARLLVCIQPGDVLLVEGRSRISTAIKYLTHSTWSHAALYVGSHLADAGGHPAHCFIEADVVEGIRSVDINQFADVHTRICRPMGLNESDWRKLTAFAIACLGNQYDLRKVISRNKYTSENSLPLKGRGLVVWLFLFRNNRLRDVCIR